MVKRKRIGILGGTFNPIHLGHLVLAEQARAILHLEKVIFVPANLPPHKGVKSLAPAKYRYHMVKLALESNPAFELSDLEMKRGGVSYSIETVREFQSSFGRVDLYFIVGSDFLYEFYTWKDIDQISKICKFVVAQRPTHSADSFSKRKQKLPGKIKVINISALGISSTDIRKRLRSGHSIYYLVPEAVRKYILRKRLYR